MFSLAYRYGNRHQQLLLPSSIEDYVSADAMVRVYDAFVDALDFGELGVDLDAGKPACCLIERGNRGVRYVSSHCW